MAEFPPSGPGCPLCDDGAGDDVSAELLAELDAMGPELDAWRAELDRECERWSAEFQSLGDVSAELAAELNAILAEWDPGGPVGPGGTVGGLGGSPE